MKRDFANKKVVVVGAGRSGLALAAYFARRGARVTLSDRRPAERLGNLEALRTQGVTLDLGGHTASLFAGADLIAVSPGVPLEVPAIGAAQKKGVPVLGEVEIAFGELAAPLIGITGTNGKSTTTSLLGEILGAWGRRTFVGGNLGIPLIEAVEEDWDWVVAELSSFQLEATDTFRPRYALLLNISEDHLDRYPDLAAYLAAKERIFANMSGAEVAVLNAEDPQVMAMGRRSAARPVFFSSRRLLAEGMGYADGEIVWRLGDNETRFVAGELRLRGEHNLENVMAALIPPLLEGCPPELAWRAARDFAGLPHRMVPVRELAGVTWYDDSKGTNVGSVVKSLSGLAAPVTLIAGGRDKGGDYGPLVAPVREKVAHMILIGEAAARLEAALGSVTHVLRATSLEEAVELANALTFAGGAVLLSPGCSSFDMFASYAERGEAFTRTVLALPEKRSL